MNFASRLSLPSQADGLALPSFAALRDAASEAASQATERLTELQLTIDGLEKERDFYFGKLRDVEILCQQPENEEIPVLQDIIKILYATEEGFEVPEEGEGGDEQDVY